MPSADEMVQPETCDVSVNVCTYNRHQQLREALESIVRNESGAGVQDQVVVVDNNSTDPTPQVVQSFIDRGHRNVRYVFEGRQGLRTPGTRPLRRRVQTFWRSPTTTCR